MNKRGSSWWLWVLALLLTAAFAKLGFWQLQKGRLKQTMLDRVEWVLRERAPATVDAALAKRSTGYDWIVLDGEFASGPAVLLDNQQRAGRVGVRVYRVFDAVDGSAWLVELGWLPLPGDRTMPQPAAIEGRQRIAGLLAPLPSRGIGRLSSVPQADGSLLVTGLESAALTQTLQRPQLASRVLKLDPASSLGYPRDLDVLPNTLPPERHRGYALQWFALAATVLIIAVVLSVRRRRRR